MTNSETQRSEPRGTSIGDLLAVVRRRWWILAICLVAFPAAAFALSSTQEKLFKAESNVLLSTRSLADSLTGNPDPDLRGDRDRVAQTQIEIAKLPVIAEQTLAALKIKDVTAAELSTRTTVSALGKTDILVIGITDNDPERAQQIANRYALQYTAYRARLDNAAISRTLREVNARLDRLGKNDDSELGDSLRDKQQELRTLQTLQTSNSIVVRKATTATQVQPAPARNASLALIFGLIVGAALILIVDSMDTRIRGADESAEALGGALLGRTPNLAYGKEPTAIAMIDDPLGPRADSVRRVLGNIEFSLAAHPARTLVVLSANDDEDRSEFVANLAIGFARSGKRVVAVDLDFRNPRMSEQFGAWGQYGLSDAAIDRVSLDQALVSVDLRGHDRSEAQANGNGTNGHNGAGFATTGTLDVLPTGSMPPDPGDFVGTPAIANLLETLATRYDLVLLDTPSMTRASDAPRAAMHADAIVLVSRSDSLKRDTARELRRQIKQTAAPFLGVVWSRDARAGELADRMRPSQAKRRSRKRTAAPPSMPASS